MFYVPSIVNIPTPLVVLNHQNRIHGWVQWQGTAFWDSLHYCNMRWFPPRNAGKRKSVDSRICATFWAENFYWQWLWELLEMCFLTRTFSKLTSSDRSSHCWQDWWCPCGKPDLLNNFTFDQWHLLHSPFLRTHRWSGNFIMAPEHTTTHHLLVSLGIAVGLLVNTDARPNAFEKFPRIDYTRQYSEELCTYILQ